MKRQTLLALGSILLAATGAYAQDAEKNSGDPALDAVLGAGEFFYLKRPKILAAGWNPIYNPKCRESVYGAPEAQPRAGEFDLCDVVPEVDSCSGQGYCLMRYKSAGGQIVEVTTYGSFGKDWNNPDRDAMTVTGWQPGQAQ